MTRIMFAIRRPPPQRPSSVGCRSYPPAARERPDLSLQFSSRVTAPRRFVPRRRNRLLQSLHFHREYRRQVPGDRGPVVAGVGGAVDLAAGGAEVDAALVERIDGHRVAE